MSWGATALAVLLSVAAATAQVAAPGWNVATLFDSLSKGGAARATFHEKKYLALLDRPVESSGELLFSPPDRLEKRTLAPRPERLVAEGDVVTLERAGKRVTIRLREQPPVAILIESIRGTLAGDLPAVTRAYSVALEGSPQRWGLVFRPLDPALGTLVERVEIAGSQAQVRTVAIFQADGDRSVMTLSPVSP